MSDRESPERPVGVSLVVPVFNGAATIEELADRLVRALEADAEQFEIIFIDDASRDASWNRIVDLATTDPRIRGHRLSSNNGHAAALAAGLARCRGEIIVTIDVDLETDPEGVSRVIRAVRDGADLASGWRDSRRRWERRLGSWAFNRHARRLGHELHDMGCGMNAMTPSVADEFVARGNLGRTLVKPILLAAARDVVEVKVPARRPVDSRLRIGDLVSLWLRFDAMERPIGLSPFVGMAVAGIALSVIGLLTSLLMWGSDTAVRLSIVAGSVSTGMGSLSLLAVSVTMSSMLQLVAERDAPFYRIVESTGSNAGSHDG